jgi:Fic family protein
MNSFKNISSATASRDLQKGVEKGLLAKTGSLNQTIYMFKKDYKRA